MNIMKKFKNTLFITVLTVFSLLSFTSCEEEAYWSRGELNFTTLDDEEPPYTNSRGEFSISVDFYDTNIIGYDPRIDYLEDFKIYNTWLSIFNKNTFRPGDQIDIYLEAQGVGTYTTTLFVLDKNGEAYLDGSYDPELLSFMHIFIDRVLSKGQARLHIYGELYDAKGRPVLQSLPFELSLDNSLDLLLSGRRR